MPGRYLYEMGMTVHKAITMVGGFTDTASAGRTKILRIVNGEEQSLRANLDAVILPEDIVVVPRSFFQFGSARLPATAPRATWIRRGEDRQ